MEKGTIRVILLSVIVAGVIMILFSAGFIIYECIKAKSFCQEDNGDYKLNIFKLQNYCNDKEIYLYEDGWDYLRIPNTIEYNYDLGMQNARR